jgi:membrane associated rhomboid family serine protease
MASLMAHPRSIGVGASGALFGITGTLLAVVLSSGGQMRELLDDRPISVGLGRPDAEITSPSESGTGRGMLTAMRGLRVWLFMFLVYNVAFALLVPASTSRPMPVGSQGVSSSVGLSRVMPSPGVHHSCAWRCRSS